MGFWSNLISALGDAAYERNLEKYNRRVPRGMQRIPIGGHASERNDLAFCPKRGETREETKARYKREYGHDMPTI